MMGVFQAFKSESILPNMPPFLKAVIWWTNRASGFGPFVTGWCAASGQVF